MKLIEVKNLTFSYDKKVNVVDDVSFSVESGKYISIIGHNGSGKSTIAKLLLGLLESNKNSIIAFGEELNDKNIYDIRNKIGIVFQNPDNQFVGSTVADDIAFGLENKCVPNEDMQAIVEEFAKKARMEKFLDKEPQNLSGGQKQRVAIAGILAMKPEVIILDEATSMLDPKGRQELKDVISEMRKENPNLSILSITHDVEEAFSSDEIIVLNKGKIMIDDTPENVLKNKEILINSGLDLPFGAKLKHCLNEQGINVSEEKDFSRMVEEICR